MYEGKYIVTLSDDSLLLKPLKQDESIDQLFVYNDPNINRPG